MATYVFFHRDFIGKEWSIIGDRYRNFEFILEELRKIPGVEILEPEEVSEDLLLKIHSKEFLESQKKAWYYQGAKLTVGGVVKACELVWKEGGNAVVFSVAAGHHAGRNHAWGGTYLSCIGPALVKLRELGLKRLALIDTDAHHGDGDRDVLLGDKNALHICFCWNNAVEEETKICVKVSDVKSDEDYLERVLNTFGVIESFKPEMIVHFFGHDTHRDDYGSLGLSERFYPQLAEEIKKLAEEICDGKYVLIDGGGANREVGERIWREIIKILAKS